MKMNTQTKKCKKIAYKSEKAAKKVIERQNAQWLSLTKVERKKTKKLQRIYKCSECGFYHLTSMTEKQYKTIKQTRYWKFEQQVRTFFKRFKEPFDMFEKIRKRKPDFQ